MAFLSNRSINALNVHTSFYSFSAMIADVFSLIYLYQVGIPLWLVFTILSGFFIIRLLVRPSLLKFSLSIGIKKSLIIASAGSAISFLILGQVDGISSWLWFYMIYDSVMETLYWLVYHTCFSMHGDLQHRGKQTGLRNALWLAGGLIAPVAGGILINTWNYWAAFVTASIFMLISAIPLLKLSKIEWKESFSLKQALEHISKDGLYVYVGESIFQHFNYVWKIVLFIMIGDYVAFGGLLSLAALFQILGNLFLGHLFDKGTAKRIYLIGLTLVAIAVFGRVTIVESIAAVVLFDLIYMLGDTLYVPAIDAAVYNQSKQSRHTLWYHFLAETGWDIGSTIMALFTAGFVYWGGDLKFAMLPSILGLIVTKWYLEKYYQKTS